MSLDEIRAKMNKLKKSEVVDSSNSNLSLQQRFLKKATLSTTRAKDFQKNLDWFNSQPLSFDQELKGKIVILDFWTYCCMNCIHVIPDIKYLENKYKNENSIIFIGVHSAKFENEKISENIENAILRYDIHHPVVNDFEMKMWKEMQISCWPTFVLISPDGKFVKKFVGEGNRDELEMLIDEALMFHKEELSNKSVVKFKTHSKNNFLSFPSNIIHHKDYFFISDSSNNRIVVSKKKSENQFEVLYLIGSGKSGFKDGTFEKCEFNHLHGLASDGNFLFVADTDNHSIRKIDFNKRVVTTLIGNGNIGVLNSKSEGFGSNISLNSPWELFVHEDSIFVTMSGSHQIWKIEQSFGKNIIGNTDEMHKNGTDPFSVSLAQPSGIFVENEFLYFTDSESSSIRKVNLNSMETLTITGGDQNNPKNLFDYGDITGSLQESKFQHPLGILKLYENLIVSDTYNHRIKLIKDDYVSNFAGDGSPGHQDSDDFSKMKFNEPSGMCHFNNFLYIADTNNHCIRCLDLSKKSSSTVEFIKSTNEVDEEFIKLDPIKWTEGKEIEFKIIIELPRMSHLHENAPSKWTINSTKGKIEKTENNSCLLNIKCKFSKELLIKCQIYYCSKDLCLMKDLNFKLDIIPSNHDEVIILHHSMNKSDSKIIE